MTYDLTPKIVLTPSQHLWLMAACKKIEMGRQPDRRVLKVELLDKLPKDFRPDDIDSRLLQNDKPTVLGLAACLPHSLLVQKTNIVWGSIHNLLLSKPSIRNVTVDEVTPNTGLPKIDVAEILKRLSEIGLYGSGTTYGEMGRSGWATFEVNERAFDAFIRYKTFAHFLTSVFEKTPLSISEVSAQQTPEEAEDEAAKKGYPIDVVIQLLETEASRGYLVIDGKEVPSEEIIVFGIVPDRIIISVMGQASLNKLTDYKFSDFSKHPSVIEFRGGEQKYPGFNLSALMYSPNNPELRIDFEFHTELWKHLWSISEFKNAFGMTLNNNTGVSLIDDGDVLSFEVAYDEADPRIGHFIAKSMLVAERLISETEANLKGETLTAYFDFPDEVAVACEQYLVYFVKFLKDLGVGAKADLRHEAGQLLFSVKPDSTEQALENIREALNIYLQLPANPNIGMMMPVGDIPTQQLVANVQFLQGGLRLAYATIQQQETTIQQRQETITNQASIIKLQQQILSGEIVSQSLRPAPTKQSSEDRAELFNGIVTLTKVEKFGVELSLAKILKKLQARFSAHSTQPTMLQLVQPNTEIEQDSGLKPGDIE